METRTYTKRELKEFIYSDFFNNLESIPISFNRAISQINNPRADEEDILLVVQYDNNQMVGYLGALPEHIFSEQEKEKCCWLTCFWVAEDYKSKNVAANLFLRIIRAWDQKILITNIVPWLEPVYQKTKIFQPTIFKSGLRAYLRLNLADILPPKKSFFGKIKPILKSIDWLLNLIIDIRLSITKPLKLEDVNIEFISQIGKKESLFINNIKHKYWNQRGAEEINWIIKHPWIIEGAKEDKNSKRYYFSSINKTFFYQIIKLTNLNNEIIGIVLINIREKNLSIPFIFAEKDIYSDICRVLINTMIYHKLSMITTYNEDLAYELKKISAPFCFRKEIKKPYLLAKKFPWITELKFQDGDGDAAFY